MMRNNSFSRAAASMMCAVIAMSARGCAHRVVGEGDYSIEDHVLAPDPPAPAPLPIAKPDMIRFHMNRHFDDLRTVEGYVIAGKLAEAKALTYLLTQTDLAPAMQQWNTDSERVSAAAKELMATRTIEQACRSEARIAGACRNCHRHTENLHIFAAPPGVPSADPTLAARLARHQWAVDRLWEGVVGAEDGSWHLGLEVLATTPLPSASNAALASHLQQIAQRDFEAEAIAPIADRATAYGELLIACSACHSTLHRVPALDSGAR